MAKRITRSTKVHETREAWLLAAIKALKPVFAEAGMTIPTVRVSVGWPGGRGKKNSVIGQCWAGAAATDGVSQVFISPRLEDPADVLHVLVHELIHAVDDCKSGHKGDFIKFAKAVGLTGKWTATVAGPELAETLGEIHSKTLGKYPHAALASVDGADGPKKQGTRMLKVECSDGSGYIVRMTRKWLDEFGAPSCPCHGEQMIEAVA